MIIFIIIVVAFLFMLWCMLKAASDADKSMETDPQKIEDLFNK